MTDYASAPAQPILQGLISVNADLSVNFEGMGVSAIARTVGGAAAGDFTLTLDPGVPGDVSIDQQFGRSLLTVRGSLLNAVPGATSIDGKALSYIPNANPQIGSNKIRVVLTAAGAGTDPSDADGDGCEIVLWRGNAGIDAPNAQLFGPLYQPVTFPI